MKRATILMSNIITTLPQIETTLQQLINFNDAGTLFKHNIPDFILVTGNELKQLIDNQRSQRTVYASTHQGVQSVNVDQILFFKSEDKYILVCHSNGNILIDNTLNNLETELSEDFVRVHRNALVAKHEIKDLLKRDCGGYYIKLNSMDLELEVSRRRVALVRQVLVQRGKISNRF